MIKVRMFDGKDLKFPTALKWTFTNKQTVTIETVGKPNFAEIPVQNVLFVERVEEETADA